MVVSRLSPPGAKLRLRQISEYDPGKKSEQLIYLAMGPSVGLRWPRIESREEVRNS